MKSFEGNRNNFFPKTDPFQSYMLNTRSDQPLTSLAKPRSEDKFLTVSENQHDGSNKNNSLKLFPTSKKFETMKSPSTNFENFNMNYKTKPCRHFEIGRCKLSGLCNFAHGKEELTHFQQLSKLENKTTVPDLTLPYSQVTNPIQKIEKIEILLDEFYNEQKQLLKQLKFLSLHIKSGSVNTENNILQMENYMKHFFESSVSYNQKIGQIMDIPKMVPGLIESSTLKEILVREKKPRDIFIENFEELEMYQVELVKKQYEFILKNLRKLPWKTGTINSIRLSHADFCFKDSKLKDTSRLLRMIIFDPNLDLHVRDACANIYEEALMINF